MPADTPAKSWVKRSFIKFVQSRPNVHLRCVWVIKKAKRDGAMIILANASDFDFIIIAVVPLFWNDGSFKLNSAFIYVCLKRAYHEEVVP